ncbi:MAG: acetyl-CoA carboxylase carboxyltransferase subunit beta [Alphaproteobacteria bacterium]|nr:acetyl-CoA carboxylase, carboxyltransferase subunit beta [Alphaproteobacteria bacterium]NCB49449.1 acetyl-CoA carboxylase carboxyltransferase subunit beta [Alphaproteobacteria bacterium]
MNWLTNYVRPKIKNMMSQKEIPDNLWEKCPSCEKIIFVKELDKNLRVCPECGYHFKITPEKRLSLLFDNGEYTLVSVPQVADDPLHFSDLKKYADRLKASRAKTNQEDAILVAHGRINSHRVVVAVFNFGFMGGSMGRAVGEALISAVDLALLQEASLIIVPASGGARMQEGILSLMQMARTTMAVQKLKEKGLPYLVLLTHPTTGGVTASFAMLGDITLSEPGAIIGFAGARVIAQTIREKLPDDFQTAEYLHDHGMVDMIVKRKDLNKTLGRIIDLLTVRLKK